MTLPAYFERTTAAVGALKAIAVNFHASELYLLLLLEIHLSGTGCSGHSSRLIFACCGGIPVLWASAFLVSGTAVTSMVRHANRIVRVEAAGETAAREKTCTVYYSTVAYIILLGFERPVGDGHKGTLCCVSLQDN